MVPTAEASRTRQMPYSAVVPVAIASARLAILPPRLHLRSDVTLIAKTPSLGPATLAHQRIHTNPSSRYPIDVNAVLTSAWRLRTPGPKRRPPESDRSYTRHASLSRT